MPDVSSSSQNTFAKSPIGLLTHHFSFLLANPISGSLQVLPKPSSSSRPSSISSSSTGGINADPLPFCLVVNIGEMCARWTGFLYPSTLHRVIHSSPTYRVFIPFFFEPNFNTGVTVLGGVRRKAEEEGKEVVDQVEVIYGEFLLSKIRKNSGYEPNTSDQ